MFGGRASSTCSAKRVRSWGGAKRSEAKGFVRPVWLAGSRYNMTSATPHQALSLEASLGLAYAERQGEVQSVTHDA